MDTMKCTIYLCMLFVVGFIPSLKAGIVSQIYIKDTVTPLKDASLQIKCNVTDYTHNVIIFESSTSDEKKKILNTCNNQKCLSPNKGGADYTVQGNTITIAIASLDRTTDQKYWWCQDKRIFLQIYTVPKTLQIDNPSSQDQDLALNSVTLKCSTDCSYPQPSFTWYYKEDDRSEQVWSSSGSITNKTGGCSESEKIYTSSLSLGRYTTLPQNLNKTVKFLCGIPTFPGMSQPVYSLPSVYVNFAVRATSVTLKDGVSTPSNTIQVISGVSKTLTCESLSRPTATIVWYIDNVEKQRSSTSSSFTFTPQSSDHNKQIYCKAFNIQPESKAVASVKAKLYVHVRVTTATLKDGSNTSVELLQLISGVPNTLACVTSFSRPTPAIVWYIDDVEKQRSSSSSSFKFTPQNSDHNKQIYCKAFNIQPENQAVASVKTTLFVQVRATSVTLKDGVSTPSNTIQVISGVSKTLTCESLSRPTATIVWYIDNVEKQRSNSSSSFTFTPQNSDHNKQIYCKAFNIQPENQAVASVNTTLYIQIRVTSATLNDGANTPSEPLHLVSGVPKTLACVTSLSRPTSTIVWYTGNVENQRSSSNSNFTFTPQNSDHDKQIYCKAFNIQPESQAVASVKTTLYVQGPPSVPKLFNFTGAIDDTPTFLLAGNLNGGYEQTFVVETAVAGTKCWTERLRFNETDKRFLQNEQLVYKFTLEGLSPNTYMARVLAGNELGWIKETDAPTINFHIKFKERSCDSATSIILGVVLGFVIIVLLFYAIYVTILLKRHTREKDQSKTQNLQAKSKNTPTYANLAYTAKPDGTEIESEDSGALAYTTLDKRLRDDKSAYESIDTRLEKSN